MTEKATEIPRTVFDQRHYLRLIEARGETIRRVVSELKPVLQLSTALDAGCGVGFFARILQEAGLNVHAFDGRLENVEEACRRFPQMSFEQGDIQSSDICKLGEFDLVLCFGLLYHLESPLLAIRNLRALTAKALLLESMCLPNQEPWMLLREEASFEDQSLTDVAFYASEGCLVKMLYRAGFNAVYQIAPFPDHDDFRETAEHIRRRTILLALPQKVNLPGLTFIPESRESSDPWRKKTPGQAKSSKCLRQFFAKPIDQKFASISRRVKTLFGENPSGMKLSFGARWLLEQSALDDQLRSGKFEVAETNFMVRFLKDGMTVLDIGAHHGFYTLLAARQVGSSGRVIAFEPSPRERVRLERHVRLNKCTNVRIEQIALGESPGPAELFLVEGMEDYCNSLRPPAVNAATRKVRVNVSSLDASVKQAKIDRVDFIKIDTEGGELDILRGARSILNADLRPVLLVEIAEIRTAAWGYSARETIGFLDNLKYSWFSIRPDGGLVPLAQDYDIKDTNLVAVPNERRKEIQDFLGGPC
jgi:FkbM family methyltransferase